MCGDTGAYAFKVIQSLRDFVSLDEDGTKEFPYLEFHQDVLDKERSLGFLLKPYHFISQNNKINGLLQIIINHSLQTLTTNYLQVFSRS
jgi:hypothetical protein